MDILILILYIIIILLWFYAIFDIAFSRFKSRTSQLIWLIIVLFGPGTRTIFYFINRRKYVMKKLRRFTQISIIIIIKHKLVLTSDYDAMANFHRIFKKIHRKLNIATCTNAQLLYLPLRISSDR